MRQMLKCCCAVSAILAGACSGGGSTGGTDGGPTGGTDGGLTSTFLVGGTVSGLAGSGLVLQDNGGDNLVISANGTFTFASKVADGGGYSVTVSAQPSTPSQSCTASNNTGTLSGTNVTNVVVVCSTNTYSVGGTVSGL